MNVKHVTLALLSMTFGCTPDIGSLDRSLATSCLSATTNPPPLAATPCPLLGCGDNAPNAGDGLLFDELDLFGHANYAGVHLEPRFGWSRTGHPLSANWLGDPVHPHPAWIDIVRDKLIVHDIATGIAHEGSDLIGTVIQLRYDPTEYDPTGEIFELRVACYEDNVQKFLANPPESPPEFVRVYDFQARRQSWQNNAWFEVCNQQSLLPDPEWTGPTNHALVYRGDKYSRDKKVVPNDPSNGWSFLACNGSAGSKMHLHRHTYAGGIDAMGVEIPGVMTTLGQRTTLLKAITADYCGNGRSDFTETGHHLAFATARDPSWFYAVWPSVTVFEAVWGEGGAICLDTPRLRTRTYVEGLGGCGHDFRRCFPSITTLPETSRGYVITGNP